MRSAKYVLIYWSIFAVPMGLMAIFKPQFESSITNTYFICLTLGITILLGIVMIMAGRTKKDEKS